jgi:hypothetical protein
VKITVSRRTNSIGSVLCEEIRSRIYSFLSRFSPASTRSRSRLETSSRWGPLATALPVVGTNKAAWEFLV